MTKLRASHGLPRVSVFPPGADEPTHVNGSPEYLSEQIKTWISQEQNWSLLRHDVNSGSQHELRFSCPRTGLTVFRGVLVQMEQTRSSLKKNKKTPKKNPTGRIEAIFLVAFGQNNNAAFQEPTRRQELCQMLNFSTLLLVFTNSRCFHNDLEEVKSKLSAALSMLDLGDAETKKAPVLSTPDSYTRWEMELPTTSATQLEIKLDCVQFRRFDLDELLTLKRLVVPSADLRPILATNASTLSVPSVMAPRDLHLQAWIEMLCFSTGCSHVAYYGLPPIGSFSSDFSKHFQIHVVGAGADEDVQIRDAFCALYANEFDTMKCCRCDKSLIAWSNTFSEELGDGQLDLVLYDPVSPFARNYYSCFTPDRIDAMSNMCTKKLSPQGWLVVLFENSTNTAASAAARPTSIEPFNRVLSYNVSDSVFADPGTCIEIFHHNSMDSLDARTELLVRLRTYKSRCYRQDVSQQHAEMWNQLDLLLEK
ncbi:hypothetical protein D915_008829 [Fasciola hepatica]|uniref:Uncharacterized protein n=1 Tax=Fasciola hepatica TaxID=6192 RepID=A0A4E0R9Q3_FASHE|nr:hypothetical protein D915_008829 [Fasciola hepatica]